MRDRSASTDIAARSSLLERSSSRARAKRHRIVRAAPRGRPPSTRVPAPGRPQLPRSAARGRALPPRPTVDPRTWMRRRQHPLPRPRSRVRRRVAGRKMTSGEARARAASATVRFELRSPSPTRSVERRKPLAQHLQPARAAVRVVLGAAMARHRHHEQFAGRSSELVRARPALPCQRLIRSMSTPCGTTMLRLPSPRGQRRRDRGRDGDHGVVAAAGDAPAELGHGVQRRPRRVQCGDDPFPRPARQAGDDRGQRAVDVHDVEVAGSDEAPEPPAAAPRCGRCPPRRITVHPTGVAAAATSPTAPLAPPRRYTSMPRRCSPIARSATTRSSPPRSSPFVDEQQVHVSSVPQPWPATECGR